MSITPTDLERHFIMDVDASPYMHLFQKHTDTTRGVCVSQGWVNAAKDGSGYSVTEAGIASLAVNA